MSSSAIREWREGWKLVLAAAVGFSFFSLMTTSLGVFMVPLAKEFGWSRTLISAGLPLSGFIALAFSPLVGAVVDKFGSRRLALPALLGMGIAISAFGLMNGSEAQWIGIWVFYALASAAGSVTVWSVAVSGMFERSRGLALGVTLTGTAVAQAVTPPLGTYLIAEFGWRMAFVLLGAGWGGAALLLCFLFFYDRQDRRRVAPAVATAPDPTTLTGLTVAQAWRDRALWQIAISAFLVMMFTIGFLVHQVPILIAAGVSPVNAAWLASLGGIAAIVGKLFTGTLMDRYRANWVGGVTLGAASLVFLFLLDGIRTPALIVAAIVINGYAAGSKLQTCTYLTARYAGLRKFGTIFSVMNMLVAGGNALGPLVAGMAYDTVGSYGPFLYAGMAGCLICGLLILTLPRYPDWRASETVPGSSGAG